MRATVDAISRCDHIRVIVLSSALDKFWTAGLDSACGHEPFTPVKKTKIGTDGGPRAVDAARAALDLHDHLSVGGWADADPSNSRTPCRRSRTLRSRSLPRSTASPSASR